VAEWEIKKTLGRCYGTSRELAVGEEYFAALVQTEADFERRDFSADYWEAQKPEVYCFWKSHVPNPQQRRNCLLMMRCCWRFFDGCQRRSSRRR